MPNGDLPLLGPRLQYEDYFIWDSSVVEFQSTLYRYALIATKSANPNDRHERARLVLVTSRNGGEKWKEEPDFNVRPNTGSPVWPNHVIWTSNPVVRTVAPGTHEFLLFITGRSSEDGRTQKIGLCRSHNGIEFDAPRVILDPITAPLAEFGYDATDSDGVYPAWRDPFPFLDPETQTWHLFFATKPLHPRPAGPVGTVGHAVAVDDSLERWQLLRSLELPQYYHQLEVPSVVYSGSRYYLFVSTQNNPAATNNMEKEAAFRAYTCRELDGRWKKVRGYTDFLFGPEVYGGTVFPREGNAGALAAVAFHSEDTAHELAGTAITPIEWEAPTRERPWPAPKVTFES